VYAVGTASRLRARRPIRPGRYMLELAGRSAIPVVIRSGR
jgi:hypothetical protein